MKKTFWSAFPIIITVDVVCVQENHVAVFSEVNELMSGNSTEDDIIIDTEGSLIIYVVVGLSQLSVQGEQ